MSAIHDEVVLVVAQFENQMADMQATVLQLREICSVTPETTAPLYIEGAFQTPTPICVGRRSRSLPPEILAVDLAVKMTAIDLEVQMFPKLRQKISTTFNLIAICTCLDARYASELQEASSNLHLLMDQPLEADDACAIKAYTAPVHVL